MSHWLEDIESREGLKKQPGRDHHKVKDRIFRVEQNYEVHKERYDGFIRKMSDLVERVNRLPLEYRETFRKLEGKERESRAGDKTHCFTASRRVNRREFRGLLRPFSIIRYKHVRLICFRVSEVMGKAKIEVKEDYLEKRRKDGRMVEAGEGKVKRRTRKEKDHFREVYYFDIGKFSEGLALQVIDWLTFREDIEHLPVIREGESVSPAEGGS